MDESKGIWSQNDEQGVINSLFGDVGRFLDVGAFCKTFSNTYKLFERGWGGLAVEPSPSAFKALSELYKGQKRVELLPAAISSKTGEMKFFDCGGDAVSTTNVSHKEKWEKGYGSKFTEITVSGITWEDLFKIYGYRFDFVDLDTEGTNWELLKLFPFDKCRPMCMCIEYDDKKSEMEAMLSKHGYRTVYTSGENIVVYRGG